MASGFIIVNVCLLILIFFLAAQMYRKVGSEMKLISGKRFYGKFFCI